MDQGHIAAARIAIGKAIAARDDVVDYWLLKAHIDIKANDRGGAFSDYEYVIQLDHGNIEALQALCQIGTSGGPLDRVDGYADQLLLLSPNAAPALTAKGNVALIGGNTDKAGEFADRVLAQDPQNIAALGLKAHVMIARGKFADAAALIEQTSDGSADAAAKLKLLEEIYAQAHDRPSYERTLRRLAQAAADDIDSQLDYADILYQDGRNDMARDVIRKVLAANPADLHVAAAVLNGWLKAGPQALDTGRMVADAADMSLLIKSDYAQFANETGHPDIAIAILHGADQGNPTPDNSNAKAALAYAIGIGGHRSEAMTQLNAILNSDTNQPWALLARARLLAAARNYPNAIRDARLLVANDRDNATAHLALADILKAGGSADLSVIALREGLRALPNSVRLAGRLAATLTANGDDDQAAQVVRDLARSAPMDLRARQLLQTYRIALPDKAIG